MVRILSAAYAVFFSNKQLLQSLAKLLLCVCSEQLINPEIPQALRLQGILIGVPCYTFPMVWYFLSCSMNADNRPAHAQYME